MMFANRQRLRDNTLSYVTRNDLPIQYSLIMTPEEKLTAQSLQEITISDREPGNGKFEISACPENNEDI